MVLQEGGLAWAVGGGVHFPEDRCDSHSACPSSTGCRTAALSHRVMGDESPSERGLSAPSLSFAIN